MSAIDSPIQYRGSLVPAEQRFRYSYDPSTGGKQEFHFDSFSEQLAVNQANASIAARQPTDFILDHGRATVIIQNTNFPGIDTWQIIANEASKSRYDSPNMLRILLYGGDLTVDFYGDTIRSLKNGIDNKSKFSEVVAKSTNLQTITGSDRTYLNNVYNLLLRGSDVYPFSQYVLRHTTNVGNDYSANVADTNVDCVYTVAQLLSETTNTSSWIYPLPGRLQYLIQHIPAPSPQTGYLWGWLKRSGTETTAANNRVDICTEYWLEQWEQTQLNAAT